MRRKFSEYGVDQNVQFTGFVDRRELQQQYARASVLICPSIWAEQFGLVGPEALASGVPCVGSAVGGIPEWLKHNEWGYLVPPRDVEQLSGAVYALLSDRNLRRKFGADGKAFVEKVHSPAEYKRQCLNLLKS